MWATTVLVGTLLYLTVRVVARVADAVITLMGAAAIVVYAGIKWYQWYTANQRV